MSSIYLEAVTADNVRYLWLRVVDLDPYEFEPGSELWVLKFDLLRAFRRYGGDHEAVAAYLLPGREDWGLAE